MAEGFLFNAPQFVNFSDISNDSDDTFFDINVEEVIPSNAKQNLTLYESISERENREPDLEGGQFFPSTVESSSNASIHLGRKIRRSLSESNINGISSDNSSVSESNATTGHMRSIAFQERINGLNQSDRDLQSRKETFSEAVKKRKIRCTPLVLHQNFKIKCNNNKKNLSKGPLKTQPVLSRAMSPKYEVMVTVPKPFSFEERDRQLMKKKEDHVRNILEEEKKAREFHAKPAPKAFLKSRSEDNIKQTSTTSNTENLNMTLFKASPATVLTKKPFAPKKEDHVVFVNEFHFKTEDRIKERRKFEERLKEKEAELAAFKRQGEEMLKKKQAEEVAQLRREMEPKAQPIRKYKIANI